MVGTRPEFIKMSPVVRVLQSSEEFELRLIHTGQHYDDALSETFFDALDLPAPDRYLNVGSGTHGEQTGQAMMALEDDVRKREPDVVLAQGDTNAVMSAAIAVSKLDVPFGHVEAGIRSFDRTMPEETNRVVADHVSDLLFAPSPVAASNLADEGITEGVFVTGNPIVDACRINSEYAVENSDILDRLSLERDDYVVATIHRPRNTDNSDRLRRILTALDSMAFPVVLPAHPRTEQAVDRIGFEPTTSLELIDPLGYLDFLRLLMAARVVVTDSGGIQEEASILEVPCLTVRPNTERPETLDAGVNELVEPKSLAGRLRTVYETDADQMVGAPHLYGDGNAGQRIVDTLDAQLVDGNRAESSAAR